MRFFVARQPIFDTRSRVYGYELLFRAGAENFFKPGTDPDAASSRIIQDTTTTFDFEELVGRTRAFVNLTHRVFVEGLYRLLPPQQTTLELLETIEPTDDIVAACTTAREAGYAVALDDFVFRPGYERLIALADVIKVDFLQTRGDARAEVRALIGDRRVKLLAEKTESKEDVRHGTELGYELFQGFFFCKPEMLSADDVAPSDLTRVRLLSELNSSEPDFARLAEVVRLDLGLSVKLLRYLNSAAFGFRHQISSIPQAITLLGDRGFRRWVSVVVLAALAENRPPELLRTALVRARFCERFGAAVGGVPKDVDLFLLGMLSAIDAILGRPMQEVAGRLGLAPQVREALIAFAAENADPPRVCGTRDTCSLRLVRAWERAAWEEVDAMITLGDIAPELVAELYGEAVQWVRTIESSS